jgi:hypothetical protein
MNEKKPSHHIGLLTMDRLFVGSKSEGLYPVLHADDGQHYRLHYKGGISLKETTLAPYVGKTVQVIGSVDNLRGHWRLVLAVDTLPLVIEDGSTISPEIAAEATFEDATKDKPEAQAISEKEITRLAAPEASTAAASEEAPPVEPESPPKKNNCN